MAETSTSFQKGRPKTGGRQKGSTNKRTEALIEKMMALDCDPIEGMARLATDENNSPELRGRMYAELAQYTAPKQRAVEHSGELAVSYEEALKAIDD